MGVRKAQSIWLFLQAACSCKGLGSSQLLINVVIFKGISKMPDEKMISIRDGCHSGSVYGKGTSMCAELRAFGSFLQAACSCRGLGSTQLFINVVIFKGISKMPDEKMISIRDGCHSGTVW